MKTTISTPNYYGFQERLSEKFPSQLLVDVAEYCNLECIHCPHVEFKKSEHYTGTKLSYVLNAKLVDEVAEYGKGYTQYIRYASNGEPLIHPQIFEMISYAVNKSKTTVTLTTNGVLLNMDRIKKLIDTGVHIVDISIDAHKNDTYSKIRVKGNLDITRANTLALINESKRNSTKTKVIVSYVEMPQNANETRDFEKFWKENGADYVIIRRLHSCSGAIQTLASETRKQNKSYERRPCLYPWERIVLNPNGYLDYCPSDWYNGSRIIDYRKTSIYETWQSKFYQNLRNAHLENNFQNHKFCGQCPDWVNTRWPHEGRSYANMVEEFKGTE